MENVQFDANNANVLVPVQSIQQVSPWHAARTSIVIINPDQNSGDVFKVGSRWDEKARGYVDLYSPAKPALMRIAAAAGIIWNWRDSGAQALQRDYVVYKAVGALRLPDGSWQPIVATKEIDLAVIEEETLEANLKKAREYAAGDAKQQSHLKGMSAEQWAQAQTRSNMIQWRKNKLMRAETGAMLRVIRAALGMKSQYTREELQRPFIVPRIDFSPDYRDPQVRQALIEHGVAAMAGLFGAAAPAALPAGAAFASRPAFEAPADDETDAFEVAPEEDDPATGGIVGGMQTRVTGVGGVPVTGQVADAVEALIDHHKQQAPAQAQPMQTQSSGDLFGQAPSAGRPAAGDPKQQAGFTCAQCGTTISEKVHNYSLSKFGQPLCYRCQQKGGGQA